MIEISQNDFFFKLFAYCWSEIFKVLYSYHRLTKKNTIEFATSWIEFNNSNNNNNQLNRPKHRK